MKVKPNDHGTVRILVYGTLKQGGALNTILRNEGAKFVDYDSITGQFDLVDMVAFPAIIPYPPQMNWKDTTIYGEIWSGNESMLAATDFAEGHPTFYERTKIWSDILKKRVWVYMLSQEWEEEAKDVVLSGIWNPSVPELEFWKAREKSEPKLLGHDKRQEV